MSTTLAIIGCSKTKLNSPAEARHLYTSKRFLAAKKIVKENNLKWVVISAKHKILLPTNIIDPYDLEINSLSKYELEDWKRECLKTLLNITSEGDNIVFFGDDNYFNPLKEDLSLQNRKIFTPLKYIGNSKKTTWLNSGLLKSKTRQDLDSFYDMLNFYANKYSLLWDFSDQSLQKQCPKQGVYIFLDKNEHRIFDTNFFRVARIGTHAVSNGSSSTLWNRLKTHMGNSNGLGNHRSSIFRSHIGEALIRKNEINIDSWQKKTLTDKSALRDEEETELMVSNYLKNFYIFCISVPGHSSKINDRAYLERNLISLLSSAIHFSDPPACNWLGFNSNNILINKSGLWNVNHVEEHYDRKFLAILETYLRFTAGFKVDLPDQLAPVGWNRTMKSKQKQGSLI